ncbi:SPOR domain-containing protein [Draconibacterium sp. IB214405]|uniref:SPOR domain-containing protein n=1 Tax=Draconibacterium sp. IB214405 TaxID=3097352 RepID=UPI002A138494|nr:SPOR domain-containing protein [Draconibacterium sp. IB214405]MDX8338575.1 SPOR domain-containing protein [Draconibacterium sp. IB214405]
MRTFLLILVGLLATTFSFAQVDTISELSVDTTGIAIVDGLDVNRDARLDKMLKWHIEKNEKREGMSGFRVEIFFSSSMDAKEQALNTKTEFLTDYPDFPVHIKFIAPNFRVRVGDFRTKNEALKLYKQVQKDYPSAFIVPDVIEFPLLKQNQYE